MAAVPANPSDTFLGYLEGTKKKVIHTTVTTLGPSTGAEQFRIPSLSRVDAFIAIPKTNTVVATSGHIVRWAWSGGGTSQNLIGYVATLIDANEGTDASRVFTAAAATSALLVGTYIDVLSFGE